MFVHKTKIGSDSAKPIYWSVIFSRLKRSVLFFPPLLVNLTQFDLTRLDWSRFVCMNNCNCCCVTPPGSLCMKPLPYDWVPGAGEGMVCHGVEGVSQPTRSSTASLTQLFRYAVSAGVVLPLLSAFCFLLSALRTTRSR